MTLADTYLNQVYVTLGISSLPAKEKYEQLNLINTELDRINRALPNPMNIKTTGTINERLVQLALEGYIPKAWHKLQGYDWMGDFAINGFPLSTIISVKSFKAKERLLVSGTGTQYAPTVGWGRFDDPSEFSANRLEAYVFRGFLAIYMPAATAELLDSPAKSVVNIHKHKLVRHIEDFGTDIEASTKNVITATSALTLLETANF